MYTLIWRIYHLPNYPNGFKFVLYNQNMALSPKNQTEQTAGNGFLSALGAPARRALEDRGITTLVELAKFSKAELLKLHGMGPSSIPKLEAALKEKGLSFRQIAQ
jgi:hypothetical protein